MGLIPLIDHDASLLQVLQLLLPINYGGVRSAAIAAVLVLSLKETQRCPDGARMVAVAQHTFAFESAPDLIESHARVNRRSDLLGV